MRLRLLFCLLALVAVAGFSLFMVLKPQKVYAQRAGRQITVPKAFGTLKGMNLSAFVFEASDGTIRVVDSGGEGGGVLVTVTRN